MKGIKIGNQTWGAENLALTIDREGKELVLNKDYFYPNGIKNLVPKYGLLYTWDAAMRVCPEGWHLPTDTEWQELIAALPKDEYASTQEWQEGILAVKSNVIFNILPVGYRIYFKPAFRGFGRIAYFWSSTTFGTSYASYCTIGDADTGVGQLNDYHGIGFSVRCVKDVKPTYKNKMSSIKDLCEKLLYEIKTVDEKFNEIVEYK